MILILDGFYTIDKLQQLLKSSGKNKLFRILIKIYCSIVFTSFVFFGLTFTIEKLNYSDNLSILKILSLAYFVFVFVIGVICLGYLANYIITV